MLPGLIDGAPVVISQALLSAPVWGNEQINGFVCNRLMQNPAYQTELSSALSAIYRMTLKAPIGEQTKTIKAGLGLLKILLINMKAELIGV